MTLLTCTDLALGYEGKEILSGISFTVNAGDYLCIIGENGSGKSTLMRTILGLQPPMRGSVTTGGSSRARASRNPRLPVRVIPSRGLRSDTPGTVLPPLHGSVTTGGGLRQTEIGYLPQQTVVQRDFPASVYEIVLSGCQGRRGLRPFYSAEDKATALENMERMGILDLKKRCYRELSGGQQQRVLLARALCATKTLLLLDEPVSGLDPKVTTEMYRLIEQLNHEGITIIMISHDIEAALRYATHILHVGRKIFFGTKERYLKSDAARGFTGGGKDDGTDL